MADSRALQVVLARLHKVKKTPNGWESLCPAHDDQHASLSVSVGEDGRVLLHCHAGCDFDTILARLGLAPAELFPRANGAKFIRPTKVSASPKDVSDATARTVMTYRYRDAAGKFLFEVVRYDPKDFRQRRPDGNGGWIWNLDGTPRVLYRLPQLLAADPAQWVFIPEGERDVDNVRSLGLVATCNPGGAGKWARLADDSALHGRRVAILPDADKVGEAHARDVAARLHGKAADVRIVRLPGNGKDVTDWLDADDYTESAAQARALVDMADAAPQWKPDNAGSREAAAGASPVMVRLSDVNPEPIRWLWRGRIPLGKLTVVCGDPGLGKSFLTLDLAARVSTGTGWPDAPEQRAAPGGVVLLSGEDDPSDTIRPRLDAAYADPKRIVLLQAICETDGSGRAQTRAFNLAQDLEALENAIAAVGDCRLVIVDPISAYLGKTDSHKNAEVRAILSPLSELAARRGVAVVAVTHLRKGEGAAVYRAMGSLAFVAAARGVFAVGRDPEDSSGQRRFFMPVKCNLSTDRTGFAYRIVADGGDVPRVAWECDPVTVEIDDVLGGEARRKGPAPEGREAAAEWLKEELSQGPRPSQELFTLAKKEGHTKSTLKRAKELLRVRARKTRFDGQWTWELSQGAHEGAQS